MSLMDSSSSATVSAFAADASRDYQAAYEKCDVILAPTSLRTAFRFGEIGDPVEMHLSDIFTVSINIAGNGGMRIASRMLV